MGLGDLGELGDIGVIVGSVVGIGISAIILLTFAPGIVGDIDGFSLAGTERCEFKGERFRWVLMAPATATDGEEPRGPSSEAGRPVTPSSSWEIHPANALTPPRRQPAPAPPQSSPRRAPGSPEPTFSKLP